MPQSVGANRRRFADARSTPSLPAGHSDEQYRRFDNESPGMLRAGALALAEMGRFELPRGFHPNLLSREAH